MKFVMSALVTLAATTVLANPPAKTAKPATPAAPSTETMAAGEEHGKVDCHDPKNKNATECKKAKH